MTTQRFMGKGQLVQRLTAQVGSKELAESLLKKRGQMDDKGELTEKGKARDSMTAAERAKDRASKVTKTPKAQLKYNPAINRAVKR